MSRAVYELRVAGVIGPAARDALSRLAAEPMDSTTVLVGPMDREALHQVLDHVRSFGLELVGIRRYLSPSAPGPGHPSAPTSRYDPLASLRRGCRVSVQSTPPAVGQVTAVAVPLAEGPQARPALGMESEALAAAGFSGSRGQTLVLPSAGGITVAVGLGAAETVDTTSVRDVAADFARAFPHHGALGVHLPASDLAMTPQQVAQAVTEGVLLSRWRPGPGTDAEPPVETLVLKAAQDQVAAATEGARRGTAVVRAYNIGRDLANGLAASLTGERLAEVASALAPAAGLELEVFDRKQLVEMRCGGLVAASPDGAPEPRLVRLRYSPTNATGHLALVGSGVTGDSEREPHTPTAGDPTGAAVILGAMTALEELGCGTSVTAYLCCPGLSASGSATRLGDVVSMHNGTTVEVLDTDAGGRLAMADGLALATEEPVDAVVDLATLGGAYAHTFGVEMAGMLGNSAGLLDQLKRASAVCDEPLWELPLYRPYRQLLDSGVADLTTTMAGAEAGSITTALFLEEFVAGRPWAHIDVSGTAHRPTARTWHTKGATGFGAMLLIELAMSFVPPRP